MKYGIYIRNSVTNELKLFAVAKDIFYVTFLRFRAKKQIPTGSSDWVVVKEWTQK